MEETLSKLTNALDKTVNSYNYYFNIMKREARERAARTIDYLIDAIDSVRLMKGDK